MGEGGGEREDKKGRGRRRRKDGSTGGKIWDGGGEVSGKVSGVGSG